MHLGHWGPILVAALAAFLLGALWYSPLLFAKAWVKSHGYSEEKLKQMQAKAGRTYAVSIVCFILMGYVLHILLSRLGAHTAGSGAAWGMHIWLGFALPIGLMANLYSDKSFLTFLIDTGYQLAFLLAMGAILAGWH